MAGCSRGTGVVPTVYAADESFLLLPCRGKNGTEFPTPQRRPRTTFLAENYLVGRSGGQEEKEQDVMEEENYASL